jgi:diguanylate cyclase (GGDEF)-like protein
MVNPQGASDELRERERRFGEVLSNEDLHHVFAALVDDSPEAWHHENDIVAGTEQRRAEIRIKRLTRVYTVLSQINALIVRVRNRKELFRETCRIAVDAGAFRMAWIGVVDSQTLEGKVLAWCGGEEGFVDKIRLTAGDGTPYGEQLACGAQRPFQPAICNDVSADLHAGELREELLRRGYRSFGCFPLTVAGRAEGVIALFSGEPNAFDEQETRLLFDLAGNISFAIDHIEKRERLDYLAYYDELTGLANRGLFLERVAQYMRGVRNGGRKLAVGMIDLERFKNINHSLGRPAGDALLQQVAAWLTDAFGDANFLARVDADHFAVVFPDVKQESELAQRLEQSMEGLLQHPFQVNGALFRVGAKVGAAIFPDDGTEADILLKNAEAALKMAKMSGDRHLFYARKMTETVAGRLTLEFQLREAFEKDEFVLYYQPKLSLLSGQLTGAEALLRWNDPRTGLVAPTKFVPILEETGLIHDVGRWALHKAVEHHLRWRQAGLAAVRIAVNVSPLQLRHRGFVAEVSQALGGDKWAAAGLELEITEGVIMEDIKHNIATLRAIRGMGASIAIDDFGTGFSSLSYLSKLPLDTLKIDRSFVNDMMVGSAGRALVSTIVSLGHALQLKVVAEGVEAEEQSSLLRLLGCDEMQGYLCGKPVPLATFEAKYLNRLPPADSRRYW